MAPIDNDLIELSYLEVILGVDATQAAVRAQAISAASRAVHEWLARKVVYNPPPIVTLQESYDGGDTELVLNEFPVVLVSVLTEGGVAMVAGTDYEVLHEEGVILALPEGRVFTRGRRSITVTYQAGHTSYTAVPMSLQQATAEWAIYLLNHQRSSGLTEDTIGQCRKIYELLSRGHPPKHVATLLGPFRSLLVGRV